MNKILDRVMDVFEVTSNLFSEKWFWVAIAGVVVVLIALWRFGSARKKAREAKAKKDAPKGEPSTPELEAKKSWKFWLFAIMFVVKIALVCWFFTSGHGAFAYAWAISLWQWSFEKFGPLGQVGYIILAGFVLWGVAYLVLHAIWIIPENHFAVVRGSIFSSRNNKVVKKGKTGLWFVVPGERLLFISRKPVNIEVEASVNLKDRLPLGVVVNILVEPDSEVVDEQGRNVFASFISDEEGEKEAAEGKEEAIPSVLKSTAKATAEEVCAQIKDFDQLNDWRSAVKDILAEKFEEEKMAHEDHDPATCEVPNCTMPLGKYLRMKDLPMYYGTHPQKKTGKKKGKSKFEKIIGGKVRRVTCTIDPTVETNLAFAERQKASAMSEANEYAMKMFDELIARDVPREVALNHVQIMLNKELVKNKYIVSAEGLAQIMNGLRAVAKTITTP